jgi:transposase
VGVLTALSFVLTLEDPNRFAKSRAVGPYLGLVPKNAQSAQRNLRGVSPAKEMSS